jgi:Asp-tRNA(Asn)/Glu-tRNA(Gln) amidotransferase B subunit
MQEDRGATRSRRLTKAEAAKYREIPDPDVLAIESLRNVYRANFDAP